MAAVVVKKKEGESDNSLIFRFTKRVQQSGVLREARKRRFRDRTPNKTAIRKSAKYRAKRKKEIEKARKLGKF